MRFTFDVIMMATFSENPNTIKDRANPIPLELDEAFVSISHSSLFHARASRDPFSSKFPAHTSA